MKITKKNSVTFMKQTIKEMILQDSEVTKILLGNEENNYKNVKELLGKNIYDYLASFSRIKNSTYILYDANLIQRNEDENVVCVSIIITSTVATVYKGNIIKNLIMDCQSYTKYRPNETTGGIFVSWRRKEELPTGA